MAFTANMGWICYLFTEYDPIVTIIHEVLYITQS